MKARKTIFSFENVFAEAGCEVDQPVRRAAGIAVLENPLAGKYVQDLTALFDLGEQVGELLVPTLIEILGRPAVSYGKAAIVGVNGDLEHGSALIHPKLGRPLRAAVGGGHAVVPSNIKIGGPGSTIDVPLANKDDPWSFPEMDTMTVGVPDAPRPNEAAVIIVMSSGTRPNARSGKTRVL